MFPIEFVTRRGDYDFVASTINFVGNCAVVSGALITLGVIASIALKALGLSSTCFLPPISSSLFNWGIVVFVGGCGVGFALLAIGYFAIINAFWHCRY